MQPHSEDHIYDHYRGYGNSASGFYPIGNARVLNGLRLVRHSPVWRQNSSAESVRAPQVVCYSFDNGLQFLFVIDLVLALVPEEQAEIEQLHNVAIVCAILHEVIEPVKKGDPSQVFAKVFQLEGMLLPLITKRKLSGEHHLIHKSSQRKLRGLNLALLVTGLFAPCLQLFSQAIDLAPQAVRWHNP